MVLLRLNTTIFIVGMLLIGVFAAPIIDRSMCVMTLGLVFAFVTQLCLLLYFSAEEERVYTNKSLFFITLIYSVIVGCVFMEISYYYDGDTFMFSKKDAMLYYNTAMKVSDIGLSYLLVRFARVKYDDWGGMVFTSLSMYIYPSKFFLNAIYAILGSLGSVMLFSVGRKLMSDSYAFLAALAYGTSSFMIFFYCSFLKESAFVFVAICGMYYLYKAIVEGKKMGFFGFGICAILLLFFRPAVAVMLVSGFLTYYAISQRGSALSVFLYIGIVVAFAVSLSAMQEMTETYTGGDIEGVINYGTKTGYSTSFTYFVSLFSALFGPLPTLFPKVEGEPSLLNFYGAGLTYRTFIILFFWIGLYYAIKQRELIILPLVVFILFEMTATGIIMASQELRKVLPHIPFTYIIMFYGLYHAQKDGASIRLMFFSIYYAIGLLFLWTIIR